MTDKEQIIWLAGLLEGEGCFSIRKRGKNACAISIKLQMTDGDIVQRAAEIMSSRARMRSGGIRQDGLPKKDVFFTDICGDRAAAIMGQILPYMGARRAAKIEEALKAHANRVTISQAAKQRGNYSWKPLQFGAHGPN